MPVKDELAQPAKVVSLMATVVEQLVTSETMQISKSREQRRSMEYYLQKTYYKTTSLISNSCKAEREKKRSCTCIHKIVQGEHRRARGEGLHAAGAMKVSVPPSRTLPTSAPPSKYYVGDIS
ncbi:hypothetical protein ACQ4PT_015036 [Festuca glaucescens]